MDTYNYGYHASYFRSERNNTSFYKRLTVLIFHPVLIYFLNLREYLTGMVYFFLGVFIILGPYPRWQVTQQVSIKSRFAQIWLGIYLFSYLFWSIILRLYSSFFKGLTFRQDRVVEQFVFSIGWYVLLKFGGGWPPCLLSFYIVLWFLIS